MGTHKAGKLVDFPKDSRSEVLFNLSLGNKSYVGLEISPKIAKIYQEGSNFSIIPFMFLLLCFESTNETNYRKDLLLDFLTAINCAHILSTKKYGYISKSIKDKNIRFVKDITLFICEFFYDDFWSNENIKRRKATSDIRSKELKKTGYGLNPLAFGVYTSHPAFEFLPRITEQYLKDCNFIHDISENHKHPQRFFNSIQKWLTKNIYQQSTLIYDNSDLVVIPKNLIKLRESYFKILCDESDLTSKQLVESLFQGYRNYSSSDGSDINKVSLVGSSTEQVSPYS